MRTLRIPTAFALLLTLSTSALLPLAGCSNGPASGTTASPVDKEEAAKQNQGIEDFYKSAAGKKATKPARRDMANP
jgi:hypothetical protein